MPALDRQTINTVNSILVTKSSMGPLPVGPFQIKRQPEDLSTLCKHWFYTVPLVALRREISLYYKQNALIFGMVVLK